MIKVKIIANGMEVDMPDIPYGRVISMTDYTKPETEIIIVGSESKKGYVKISKAGLTIDHTEYIREIQSADLQHDADFKNEYRKKFMTKFGPAELILKHEDEIIN